MILVAGHETGGREAVNKNQPLVSHWYINELCDRCGHYMFTDGHDKWCPSRECSRSACGQPCHGYEEPLPDEAGAEGSTND